MKVVVFAGMVTLGFILSDEFIFQCKSTMPSVGYTLNSFLGWVFRGLVLDKGMQNSALFIVYINNHTIITALQHRAFHLGCRSAVLNTVRS